MEIIQYVQFTDPTEKEKLEQLMKECNSELELQSKISKTFKLSNIDARVVIKRFRNKFNQIKQQ